LQDEFPDHVGSIVADIHDFVIFATFANQVHPGHVLTRESINIAAKFALKSESPQAKRVFFALRQAFGIQSGPKPGTRLSKETEPPYATLRVIEEWYKGYVGHKVASGKVEITLTPSQVFLKLLTPRF
jgi:hypothetical protein